jgi:hypothetical protein
MSGLDYSQGSLYAHVSSLELFTAKSANQEKNVIYSLPLRNYFEKSDRKSNPVIVRFKLKKTP